MQEADGLWEEAGEVRFVVVQRVVEWVPVVGDVMLDVEEGEGGMYQPLGVAGGLTGVGPVALIL